MAETKIQVPEGMLNAAWEAVAAKMRQHSEERQTGHVAELHVARIAIEAALRWQSENPPVPTDEQMDALTNEVPYDDSGNGRIFRVVLDKWVRRMSLAPEEPDRMSGVLAALSGRTFTQDEADLVYDYVQRSVHGGRCPCMRGEKTQEPAVLTHLIRDFSTLCGLTEWEQGNVDIKFGIEKGITTCLKCLRAAYLESLSVNTEPTVPEEIKDLLVDADSLPGAAEYSGEDYNEAVIKAFRRGQQAKEK